MVNALADVELSVRSYILSEFLEDEDPNQLMDDTPLITTGILDSIAVLKLVIFLEERFTIAIEPDETDAEHLDTIERITQLVQSKS